MTERKALPYMDIETILKKIKSDKPKVVYLSGKTCTGKTTFAGVLEELQYSRIELDQIVTKSIVEQYGVFPNDAFLTAYRGEGLQEHTQAFIAAAKQEIISKMAISPVVVEGAVAKAEILSSVFSGLSEDFFFIYFHPHNIDVYAERIKERFVNGIYTNTTGLPKRFWSLVRDADIEEFKISGHISKTLGDSILEFARTSAEESKNRLEHLMKDFPNIYTIEF